MSRFEDFTRQELRELEKRALVHKHDHRDSVANESWQRAYQRFADAANILDAFYARSTVGLSE